MNNVILGSGIVGLLAKAILGPTWKIIPFYRSRFFSFNPALDDNFIIASSETDAIIKQITNSLTVQNLFYSRAWSVSGQLVKNWDSTLCEAWLRKIFGVNIPPQSMAYYTNRLTLPIYNIRANQLYTSLLNNNASEIESEASKGLVSEIGDHYLIRNGVKEEFDNAVCTIPLDALCKLLKSPIELPSKTLHYYHIQTDSLDFEGFNQQLVVDQVFDFYRVANIAPDRYLFYCHNEITNPGLYFMPILKSFEILDGTTVLSAIPSGTSPKLDLIEKKGLYMVGSSAQWDWCMDIGSCVLRLQRYSQRGFKPFKPIQLV